MNGLIHMLDLDLSNNLKQMSYNGFYKVKEDFVLDGINVKAGEEVFVTNQPIMSHKPTRFQKELQKEIDRLESVVLTEQLKESLAKERKEGAQKQIETLKEQLNVGAYASL